MLLTLILYLTMAAIGAMTGAKILFSDKAKLQISNLQLFSIILLILTVGASIGSDKNVISTLPSLGASAFTISALSILGSILFLSIGRRLLGFNKFGIRDVNAEDNHKANIRYSHTYSGEQNLYIKDSCDKDSLDKGLWNESFCDKYSSDNSSLDKYSENEDSCNNSSLGKDSSYKDFENENPYDESQEKKHYMRTEKNPEKSQPSLTKIILITVIIGMFSGYFFIPDSFINYSGNIMTVGLCILLFTAGVDIGCQKGVLEDIKRNGLRILAFPILIYMGTFAGGALAALLLKYTVLETVTVAAGMGWATLSPVIIAEKSAELSAVSFLANIMREFLSITFAAVVAKKIGYIEALAPAGVTAMDTSLPVIERATNSSVVICSFISGTILSASVPIVTPILTAML